MALSLEDTDECRIEFCRVTGISDDDWKLADISWSLLSEIGRDHVSQTQSLSASATMYANIIQGIKGVHSVRWRVKDEANLLAKIVRKRAENKENYIEISVENYYEIVTDLVGIRALHLLKSEIDIIHGQLNPLFQEKEPPIANIRNGDPDEVVKACEALGLVVRTHPAGYRSIHYVKTVKPINRRLHIEIQVRTVFEEGWSEIDHRVRYPNFSNDPLVVYASQILNRLSGMADEMSTYAMQLTNALSVHSVEIENSKRERDEVLERVGGLVREIEILKDGDVNKASTIENLKREVDSLQKSAARDSHLNSLAGLGASHSALSRVMLESLSISRTENAFVGRDAKVSDFVIGLGAAKANVLKKE
jgi:putative GTP pyrophosphokinase